MTDRPPAPADGAALPARAGDAGDPLPPAVRAAVAAATPARLFLGGSPVAYRTRDWLELRADHAAAQDAVAALLEVDDPALEALMTRHRPLVVESAVPSPAEHLTRPDLGRTLSARSRAVLAGVTGGAQLALVLGDGLSARAALAQGPALVDALTDGARARGWATTPVVVARYARVGLLNELGPLLGADVVVLLVGERPGLGAADSLSAYMAFRPGPGHTDAHRNLVSGIHARGTPILAAAVRILDLVAQLLDRRTSGVLVKEVGGGAGPAAGEQRGLASGR